MKPVKGIGGVFFKAQDPDKLRAWYKEHLGLELEQSGGAAVFKWREIDHSEQVQSTVWSAFPHDTQYFAPSSAPFMINYIVDNLDQALDALRAASVPVDNRIEDSEYGRFGWATDPEGNRFELWEPPQNK